MSSSDEHMSDCVEHAAFATLPAEHRSKVRKWARSRFRDRKLVADFGQELSAEVTYRKIPEEDFWAWFKRSEPVDPEVDEALGRMRGPKKKKRTPCWDTYHLVKTRQFGSEESKGRRLRVTAVDPGELPDDGSAGPSPEELVLVKEQQRRDAKLVNEAMAELRRRKPDHAWAVWGHDVEGTPHKELARRRGIPPDTIRTWVLRGRLFLKRKLRQNMGDK